MCMYMLLSIADIYQLCRIIFIDICIRLLKFALLKHYFLLTSVDCIMGIHCTWVWHF